MTISFHLYILRISKVWNMLHHGSVGQVQSKECYFTFTYTYATFFVVVVVFHKKFCVFIIFISFSDDVSNFCNKILTNLKPELMIRYLLLRTVCITSKCNPHFDDYIKCKRPSQMIMF